MEVLGKGGMGTSYKAVLEEGTTVVVKAPTGCGGGAARHEFTTCMEIVGHRNLVPVRVYYYYKDSKTYEKDVGNK